MYLPFLRGKLFELKAIKEFIDESYGGNYGKQIMPIIEPVKEDIRPIMNCIDAMHRVDMPFAIVLNSRLGDYRRSTLEFDITAFLADEKMRYIEHWVPAFEVTSDTEAIKTAILEHNLSEVMLIFFSGVDYENAQVRDLLNQSSIAYIVVYNLGQNRTMQSRLRATDKHIITIENRFIEQSANVEYSNIDEFFTDTFNYYEGDGMFGFSDFTALARNYREGGTLPQVVAIHITYERNPEEVYVHHFLSDSKNGKVNIREEYKEACDKIKPFFVDKQSTQAVLQLIESEYPGLGAIKKFSIKNHLELMSRILHKKEAQ